ncbi:hypothetical protein CH274_13165 [Rhodococcus sp. 06-418-5]|uniref:hypothetical protein n=1 Tax=Rhodococcus sp. 06-418-5 TaxID=2022507 RepID=UPI000B9A5563|nr:hypothetical protein [Rhodococcus sp. 06-418-5]OZC80181.1 hypothetical protein CH274_13165 [Rhodococcus sp. 06-418-5]
MADNAIDIITRNVTAEITARFEGAVAQFDAEVVAAQARADALFARLEVEGQRRMDELFSKIPTAAVITEDGDFDPVGWIKSQAKSRALRTLVQGGLAAVVIAFVTAVVQQVADPNFDFTEFSDWKIAIGLGLGAVGTAASSYLQNKLAIKPPKVQ